MGFTNNNDPVICRLPLLKLAFSSRLILILLLTRGIQIRVPELTAQNSGVCRNSSNFIFHLIQKIMQLYIKKVYFFPFGLYLYTVHEESICFYIQYKNNVQIYTMNILHQFNNLNILWNMLRAEMTLATLINVCD